MADTETYEVVRVAPRSHEEVQAGYPVVELEVEQIGTEVECRSYVNRVYASCNEDGDRPPDYDIRPVH